MSHRFAGSCVEPVMVKGLTFLFPWQSREKTHALLNPNLKPDTQARRTSPSAFFPVSSSEEGSGMFWASLLT